MEATGLLTAISLWLGLLFRKWPAAEEETSACSFKNNNRKENAWGGRSKVLAVDFPEDVCTCGRT